MSHGNHRNHGKRSIFASRIGIMKVIVTIKAGNKAAENFCQELDMTPQECEKLKDIARRVNQRAGEECITAYVHQI